MPRTTLPLAIGGQYSAGDSASIPAGYCRLVRNHLHRPGPRLDARPPFVYDSLMSVQGLFTWDDLVNQTTRFGALNDTVQLQIKATSGETWGSGISASGVRMTDYANFLGKAYLMFDDGAGNPSVALSFDGTNVSSTPFTSTFASRCVTAYKERLFLSYPRVTVSPVNGTSGSSGFVLANCYGSWASSSATVRTVVSGTTSVTSVFPSTTSGTTSVGISIAAVAASATDLSYVVRQDFRYSDPTNDLPVTCYVNYTPNTVALQELTAAGARSLAVTVGQIAATASSAGATLWRCMTAGTTAVAAPTFTGTALGGTVTDGTAVWLAVQSSQVMVGETSVPNATAAQGTWSTRYFRVPMPWRTNTVSFQVTIGFYNTSVPNVLSLNPVDMALKDGLADGDARKQNYGHQITAGDYYYPFINTETATSSTQNLEQVVWTEIQSNVIRAANNFKLNDVAGLPTASIMAEDRLLVFKRRAFWQFSITSDPDNPLALETINRKIGCVSPRAIDSIDGEVYFIGEDEIYHYKVGSAPVPLCGEGMREEIMSKSASTWVESQSTYKMPILAIDQKNREVWVYTQKGVLYCYNLAQRAWSKHDVSNSAEVRAMLYNPNTQEMYVSFGANGLARLDPSLTQTDTIESTNASLTMTADVTFKPVENYAPRVDFTAESFGAFHLATASQSTDTVTLYWSTDGVTFTDNYPTTLNLTIKRNQFPVWKKGPSLTFRLRKVGRAGAAAWSLVKADVAVNVHRGEWPSALPAVNGTPTYT